MKKIIIILVIALVPAWLLAQETPLTSLYKDFSTKSGYKSTEIKPGAMNFEWEKTTEFPRFREMMKNIESIRILQYQPEKDLFASEKLWKKVQKAAADERYTEVISANGDDFNIRMYVMKGTDNIAKEAALCLKDDDRIVLVTITGNLDFSSMFSAENMQALRDMGKFFMDQKGQCHHDSN